MHIVSFYKLCEVITGIYSITRPFNDRVSLRLKKMINCYWITCYWITCKAREKWATDWVIFFWVHFKIREYFCIILKYVDFYIQAPFLDQKHWNDKNKINKTHVEISCWARCWDLSWQLNALVDKVSKLDSM